MKAIALDAMGGDYMPQASVAGAVLAAKEGIPVILVGDAEVLKPELAKHQFELPIHHSSDVITMDDHAGDVRKRKGSSIMQAMQLVKDSQAAAAVSMGHSGATMAAALLVLGRIKGVDRPAILATIPSRAGFVALLDVGANADCRAAYLQQFAVMGTVYARAFFGKMQPTVGLMSIGEEEHKGNELTKEAHELLNKTPNINFFGNVEGRDLLKGSSDVMVTDGFTGNVILKLAEGEAKELFGWIRAALVGGSWLTKIGAALVKPALRSVAAKLDPSEYGAQPLLGVKGYAFIGHGSSDAKAVLSALRTARRSVEAQLLEKIAAGMAELPKAMVTG